MGLDQINVFTLLVHFKDILSSDFLFTAVVRSPLPPGVGGQLVLGQTIPAPLSGAACVTLSYNFEPEDSEEDDLPELQVI